MTVDKDFKRIVRAKARASGQSYSTVLRRLRSDGRAPSEETRPMMTTTTTTIMRTVPDVTSKDLSATRQFYEGLLGFQVVMDVAGMLMFASPSERKQQITANASPEPQPPGVTVDVGYPEAVTSLYERAQAEGRTIVKAIEDIPFAVRLFSMLDPDGTRVTVVAHLDRVHQPPRE